MPCFRWVREQIADARAHAVATKNVGAGVATTLCGRTLSTWKAASSSDPRCDACTTRDEDIHRHADHRSSAPRSESRQTAQVPVRRTL